MARHLIDLGHTHIAGLFKMDDLQGPERYLGIASCLRDLGYELKDRHVGWFNTADNEALRKNRIPVSSPDSSRISCPAVPPLSATMTRPLTG